MIKEREVSLDTPKEAASKRPTLIKWQGVTMIRRHSVIAAVKEVLNIALGQQGNNLSKGLDVAKIGIIGEESTGKTTAAELWCHLLHKYAEKDYKIPFAVRMFGEEEFLDFKGTLASLEPTNHILYFRDLSFLQDKKALGNVKQAVTKIRHLPGGQDVKIILVYDYHYTLGLDKYLRQSHIKIFTSAGSSEAENIEKIFGTKHKAKILEFQKIFNEMITKHKATFRIGPKAFFSYSQWNPFGIVLLWNGTRPRFIVSPSRPWIDKLCNTCTAGAHGVKSEMSIPQVVEHGNKNFGPGNFEAAVKLDLFQKGIVVYAKKVVQARKWLAKLYALKQISPDDLALHYNYKITNTRLRKKLDDLLGASK